MQDPTDRPELQFARRLLESARSRHVRMCESMLAQHFKCVDDEIIVVDPETGEPRTHLFGEPYSVGDLIRELGEQHPIMFPSLQGH